MIESTMFQRVSGWCELIAESFNGLSLLSRRDENATDSKAGSIAGGDADSKKVVSHVNATLVQRGCWILEWCLIVSAIDTI